MRNELSKTRARARGARRGAVLVEAILVIVVLLLFLLAFLYVRLAFERQLQVQRTARAAAFGFAMNGCEGAPPSDQLATEDAKLIGAPATSPESPETVADAENAKNTDAVAAGAFTKIAAKNTGFGMPAAVSVSARDTASVNAGSDAMSSNMHSRTTLLCNEKPRAGKIDNVIQYVLDFLKI